VDVRCEHQRDGHRRDKEAGEPPLLAAQRIDRVGGRSLADRGLLERRDPGL
jgi:hypothetical protein